MNFKCYTTSSSCCKCPGGISPKVSVSLSDDPNSNWEYYATVSKAPGVSHYWNDMGKLKLDYFDIFEKTSSFQGDKTTYIQLPIIHEIGHLLGLSHPGQRLPQEKRPPQDSEEDYKEDPGSLMGAGSNFRLVDFNDAFCSKIEKYPGCNEWKGK